MESVGNVNLCHKCRMHYNYCICNKKTTEEKYQEQLVAKGKLTVNEVKSNGGGDKNHYDLPKGANQLLDLIEYRNMNGNIKDIFKACYRLGEKENVSVEYDMQKIVLYGIRELGRVQGRKDYVKIAEEVIGHHDKTRGDKKTKNSDNVKKGIDYAFDYTE